MLGKLMKYEFKATARVFLPLYGALLVFSVILKIFHSRSISELMSAASGWLRTVVQMTTMLIYAILITAVFVIALIMVIQRFQKNLLGDEGYLMFTLPANPWQHISSKLVVAAFWSLASCGVALLSVVILVAEKNFFTFFWSELYLLLDEIARNLRIPIPAVVAEGLLLTLSSAVNGIASIYAAIALGQLFKRHKTAGAFVAFLALMAASGMLTNILSRIIFGQKVSGIMADLVFYGGLDLQQNVLYTIIINLLLAAGYFLITNAVLTRRLNLE